MKDSIKLYGARVANSLYHVTVYSILAYSGLLFLLAIIGMAVFLRVVEVPEFHPK
jgi:hypothetical protein